MKLVTFRTPDRTTHAGVVFGERVFTLDYPTVLELLRDPEGLAKAHTVLRESGKEYIQNEPDSPAPLAEAALSLVSKVIHERRTVEYTLNELVLLPPIPDPPSVRDFYAFEQHVKTVRARRGVEMIPEWYEIPTFYFSNNSEIYGHDELIPYPVGRNELDIELEIARYKRAMRRGILALEGVEQPPAFHGVFAGHGRRSGSFAGPRDGKDVWNVQPECRRITVRWKVCERKPPCWQQQVREKNHSEKGELRLPLLYLLVA